MKAMAKETVHAAVKMETFTLGEKDAGSLAAAVVTRVDLACGSGFRTDLETQPIASVSDAITCKRCRKALAAALPSVNAHASDSLWRELCDRALDAAVDADRDVASVRGRFDEALAGVERVFRRALADVEGARGRKVAATGWGSAMDLAGQVQRVVGFVAVNVDSGALFRAAAEFDRELARVVRAVDR